MFLLNPVLINLIVHLEQNVSVHPSGLLTAIWNTRVSAVPPGCGMQPSCASGRKAIYLFRWSAALTESLAVEHWECPAVQRDVTLYTASGLSSECFLSVCGCQVRGWRGCRGPSPEAGGPGQADPARVRLTPRSLCRASLGPSQPLAEDQPPLPPCLYPLPPASRRSQETCSPADVRTEGAYAL